MRTVSVKVLAEMSGYMSGMRRGVAATKELTKELDAAAKGGRAEEIAQQAGALGIGMLGAAGAAVKLSADFDKAMSGVAAATHASATEIESLRQAALQAGKDTQFSATEAAKGITELSKAGISTANILGGGLKGALDLAAAGQMEVAEAAETVASALTQFKLKGKDVPHVADLLAAAAGKAQGSVHDMGMALNQAGLVAAQTGLSIEETTGGLAAFASAGLMGSDAGTSFKQMLLMLQAPSGVTRDLMKDLGISAYDAQGRFVGLAALAQQLRDKLGHLTPELRANAMAQIFGADAVRGASILYEQGAAGIQSWIDEVNHAGYASETARIQTDNLIGDLERLKGSLETMAIESGSGANSGLRVMAKSANALVDQFSLLPSSVSGTITVLGLLSGALMLGASGWLRMRRSNAEALEELRNTGPAGERAANGLQTTTKWAGRAAAAFAATQVAAAGMSAAFGNSMNPQVEALSQNLEQWSKSGAKAGEAARMFGKDFELLAGDLSTLDSGFWTNFGNGAAGVAEAISGLGSVVDDSLQHTRERITGIDSALSAMVQGGKTQEAAAIFNKLAAEAKKSGVNVEELKKGLPQYAAAVQTAGSKSAASADQIGEVGTQAETTADKVEKLEEAFADLFDSQMSADRAQLKFEQGMVSLKDELTKGKRTLALNTEEGRKNRGAVLDQLEAIEKLRDSRVKHGATLDDANKKYLKDIEGLKKTLRQAGFTKKEIDALIGAYEEIPDKVNTSVTITGDKAVGGKLTMLSQVQSALKRGAPLPGPARKYFGPEYDEGGWTGPGEKYAVAGVVHADEHVIRKDSRRKLEAVRPGALDYMNETGRWPGYAKGGRVAWPFPVTAAMTRIPSAQEVTAAVVPVVPGGATGPWLERMLESRFGAAMISGFRPGSRTLSGALSYHALNRAVDFPAIREMAAFMYNNYKARLKEAITPWQEYNVHNGRSHRYTGAVWNQHNFAGGNAHNHFAMARGGTIREPVFGVGASGATYSFGENYQSERVIANWQPNSTGLGGSITIVLPNNGVIGSPYEMETWLAKAVDNLRSRGRM